MSDSEWLQHIDALVYRIQKQEHIALELLYDESAPRVYAILFRVLKSPSESEDALQDVFIKVWQQANKFQGKGSAWGWICVLARHLALDRLRQLQRAPNHSADALSDEELFAQIDQSQQLTDRHWLGQCLKKVKPQTRQAILLSYIEGYSHGEISLRLNTPLGTVKAWIRRGMEELKQCLAP